MPTNRVPSWLLLCVLSPLFGCGSPTAAAPSDTAFDDTRLQDGFDDPAAAQFLAAEGSIPTSVPAALGPVSSLAVGLWHNCALDAAGEVHCWGYGEQGETRLPPALGTAVQLGMGEARACAVNAAGAVRCWGVGSGIVPATFTGVVEVLASPAR